MPNSENQFLFKEKSTGVEVWIKRLDIQFPLSIGNKAYKLKYNLKEAERLGYRLILTFGGAFSNHIAAVAAQGNKSGFKTIGVIRGEELGRDLGQTISQNPTLALAKENGMLFEFVSRKAYRDKETSGFRDGFFKKYGNMYIIPEGGTNDLAVKGCGEILTEEDKNFNVICCPVGTGGTLSGLINSSEGHQILLGFSALNASSSQQIKPFVHKQNWEIFPESHFGGFAKINEDLVSFMNEFKQEYGVLLDPIYTGKMMFALIEKIKSGFFRKNSRILAIHTGGLQGISGMNGKLKKNELPIINY